ncbi:MAG: hypothetical protein QXE64_02345 [Candidatus Pacearchaeota archaeon]
MHFKRGRGSGKKAAITLYVIIALIVVAAGLLTYFFMPDIFRVGFSKQKAQQILTEQSEALRDAVLKCVSSTVKLCLNEIGMKGGYYYVGDLWYSNYAGPKYIVVYTDEVGKFVNKLPSVNAILSKSLVDCLDDKGYDQINDCINFDGYRRFFSVDRAPTPKLSVSAGDCNVYIAIDWPMTLSKFTLAGTTKKEINQKNATLPICLREIWELANDIINMEIQGKEWVNNADAYIIAHPFTMKRIDMRMQYYPTFKQPLFMLKTIPFRPDEEPFPFYFGIDKERRMGIT